MTKTAFFFLILLFIALIFLPKEPFSRSGHLTLLSVIEDENNSVGTTADLFLTIKPGDGNIFISTSSFTRLDTQISTEFAKEVACKHVQKNCDNYDFFYTISSSSSIVGGASAGAALSALTAALLDNQQIKEGYAITGTISSGGLIGPIAGVEEKVLAAQKANMVAAIIPKWQTITPHNSSNETQVPLLYETNITVINVTTLKQLLTIITHKDYTKKQTQNLQIPESFTTQMQTVAQELCTRTQELKQKIPASIPANNTLYNQSLYFLELAKQTQEQEFYYSQASYCFSANLRLRELQLQNYSQLKLIAASSDLKESIQKNTDQLNEKELFTLDDIQTKAIVSERLIQANELLQENVTAQTLAYAIERHHSAIAWSKFFSIPGSKEPLSKDHLQNACEKKLSEVQERLSYIHLLFNGFSPIEFDQVDTAYEHYYNKDYALCLFKASKSKASIDSFLTTVWLDEENFEAFIQEKLTLTKQIIAQEADDDRFPFMGYSYYEYANTLTQDDPYLASLFASYALELSDLSIYFPQKTTLKERLLLTIYDPFFLGFMSGAMFLLIITFILWPKDQKKRTRRRPS